MPRNYDSSAVGVPYVRVPLIEIKYPEPHTAHVRVLEVEAVKLADGSIRELRQLGQIEWHIGPGDMGKVAQIPHPDTGAPTGATTTNQQLMLGLLAAIRAQQLLLDAPPPAPAPVPSGEGE
jgi:hypothetical protein